MSLSRSLYETQVIEIGLQFDSESVGPFLCTGVMTGVFHISGTNATDKSCSKIIAKGKAIAFLTRLKNKGGSIHSRKVSF